MAIKKYRVIRVPGMGKRTKWVVVKKPIIRQLVKEKVMIEVGINPFAGTPREIQTQSSHILRQE